MKRKVLKRLKKENVPFSVNTFYIIFSGSVFQIRDRDTHFVVATGNDIEDITLTLDKLLRKYKTETYYKYMVNHMSEKEGNTKTLDRKAKEYRKHGQKYNGLLEERIGLLLNKVVEKKGRLLNTVGAVENTPSPILEEKKPVQILPKRRPKKKLVKRIK